MLRKKRAVNIIIPGLIVTFNIFILAYPKEIIAASADGIRIWFNQVFPSLFPFMIGVNILSSTGLISLLSVFAAPLMRAVFNIPGAGGFALISGMISGYPMGAKLTAELRESNRLSKAEAQRLLCFANNSGPLFIIGTVGAGMFKSASIGYFILLIHYLAAILTGFVCSFYGCGGASRFDYPAHSYSAEIKKDDHPFVQILSASVVKAMEAILQIGGFIILFSVITKMIELTGLLPQNIYGDFAAGLLEVTNGAGLVSSGRYGLHSSVIAAAGLVSFGGFSIHAQAAGFIYKTDLKISVYILGKILHCLITIALGIMLIRFFDFM